MHALLNYIRICKLVFQFFGPVNILVKKMKKSIKYIIDFFRSVRILGIFGRVRKIGGPQTRDTQKSVRNLKLSGI